MPWRASALYCEQESGPGSQPGMNAFMALHPDHAWSLSLQLPAAPRPCLNHSVPLASLTRSQIPYSFLWCGIFCHLQGQGLRQTSPPSDFVAASFAALAGAQEPPVWA